MNIFWKLKIKYRPYILSCHDCKIVFKFAEKKSFDEFGKYCPVCGKKMRLHLPCSNRDSTPSEFKIYEQEIKEVYPERDDEICNKCMEGAPFSFCCKLECGEHMFCMNCTHLHSDIEECLQLKNQ